MSPKERQEKARRERNARITSAVKAGEVIPALVHHETTHFPPRPAIKKDLAAMRQIHGEGIGPELVAVPSEEKLDA